MLVFALLFLFNQVILETLMLHEVFTLMFANLFGFSFLNHLGLFLLFLFLCSFEHPSKAILDNTFLFFGRLNFL